MAGGGNATAPDLGLAFYAVSTLTAIFERYVLITALSFGFVGNLLSIAIFIIRRQQDRASASYLAPLAVFDTMNVCMAFYFWLVQGAGPATNGLISVSTYADTDIGCYSYLIPWKYGMFMSGWIILAFSSERLLVVWFPLKMAPLLTTKTRRKVILSIVCCLPLFAVILITEPQYFPKDQDQVQACLPRASSHPALQVFFWIIVIAVVVAIPCLLIMIVNILILIGVFKNSRKVVKHSEKQSANEKRCLINLIMVSTFYWIFMCPYAVFWSLTITIGEDVPLIHMLTLFSVTWASLNYCINPVLYSFGLKYYREEALILLTCGMCGKKKKKPQTAVSSVSKSSDNTKSTDG